MTGLALVFGYALLGAGWLVLKLERPLQDWARSLGRYALAGVIIAIVAVSLWTPMAQPGIAARWFSWPNVALLAPVPIITALIAWLEWRSLNNRSEAAPFVFAVLLFVMSYIGIAISLFPMIVPYKYTIWEAASSPATQAFLLVGTLFLLPIILMYTAWSYLGVPRQGAGGHRDTTEEGQNAHPAPATPLRVAAGASRGLPSLTERPRRSCASPDRPAPAFCRRRCNRSG